MYLYPKTLRKGNFLGAIDIVVRKPNVDEKPTESHILYIENGEAFYATSVSPQNSNGRFKTEFSIGDASLVAIDFDAEWVVAANGKYRPISLSEPWLMRVNGNQLLAQKGETFNPLLLDTGNITSLKAIRGWQNRVTEHEDHGLVVLYVKDGLPYYVNYSWHPQGYREWSDPQLIPNFENVTAITGFRSNDYRLVVLLEIEGSIHQIVSKRNWAGMGIQGEKVMGGIDDVKITLTELTYTKAYNKELSKATASPTNIYAGLHTIRTANKFLSVYNPDAFTIIVTLDEQIHNLDVTSFRVVDGRNRTFRVSTVSYNRVTTELTFVIEDFNNARDGLTVHYDAAGTSKNILGNYFVPFSISFMPEGLVPLDIPVPAVVSIRNVEG
jgi:hypothetical protein